MTGRETIFPIAFPPKVRRKPEKARSNPDPLGQVDIEEDPEIKRKCDVVINDYETRYGSGKPGSALLLNPEQYLQLQILVHQCQQREDKLTYDTLHYRGIPVFIKHAGAPEVSPSPRHAPQLVWEARRAS